MIIWILLFLTLSINDLIHAELIRVPLTRSSGPLRSGLAKRIVGYSELVDVVFPGIPNIDLAYLGAVSIGQPPQEFLLSNSHLKPNGC